MSAVSITAEAQQQQHSNGDADMLSAQQFRPPSSSQDSSDVKVVVRVRPQILNAELQPGAQICVQVEGHNVCTVRSPHDVISMPFNWVAGPATSQSEFFKVVGRSTVENCLSGFNSSIFAYGQTGSGKTHTMIGELPTTNSASLPANAGIIPRIFKYLWQRMPEVQAGLLATSNGEMPRTSSSNGSLALTSSPRTSYADEGGVSSGRSLEQPRLRWLVRCSMLEIYREDVYDLLRPGKGPLNIREDIRKGVYVEGLCEQVAESVTEALTCLRAGIMNRQVTATETNATSSRSHCIFICHIESRLELQAGMVNVRSSRLHLVDLAGSERLKGWHSGAGATSSCEGGNASSVTGDSSSTSTRRRETASINSSLAVLGLVILKLTEQQPHIPYRNSKLTFLLQDSIGGNAKTVIIANISPSEVCVQETLSTLGFAARARKIVNKAAINEDHRDDVALLRQKVKRLQQELCLARALAVKAPKGGLLSNSRPAALATPEAKNQAAQELSEQQEQLAGALQLLEELGGRNSELEQAVEFCRRERDVLEQNCLEVRQELAAMQVSLQQALSPATKKHRWFRPGTAGKADQAVDQQQLGRASHAAAACSVEGEQAESNTGSCSKAQAPATSSWSFSSVFSRKDKARRMTSPPAAATASATAAPMDASPSQGLQQQQQQQMPDLDGLPELVDGCQQQVLRQQHEQTLEMIHKQLADLAWHVCSRGSQHQQHQASHGAAACQDVRNTSSATQPPSAAAAGPAAADDWAAASESAAAGADQQHKLSAAGLLQLQELQRQQGAPHELQGIVSALRSLVAWQQQQQQHGVPAAKACNESEQGHPGRSKVAPSELHRQLFEERELSAQLQARIRQLQQELLLAGGPVAPSITAPPHAASVNPLFSGKPQHCAAARPAQLSPGVGVHFRADADCMQALQSAPALISVTCTDMTVAQLHADAGDGGGAEPAVSEAGVPCCPAGGLGRASGNSDEAQETAPVPAAPAEDTAFNEAVSVVVSIAAGDVKAAQQADTEVLQLKDALDHEPRQEQTPAHSVGVVAEQQQVIAELRVQVCDLQQRLEVAQRERSSFHCRLQSARSVIAAARCSTPTSLLSSHSGLSSPQPSFSLLEPVFGNSIEEVDEEEEDGTACGRPLRHSQESSTPGQQCSQGSLDHWHPQPHLSCSPQPRPVTPCADVLHETADRADLDSSCEELTQSRVWQQQYVQVQQYQQQYKHTKQLVSAVHAAIAAGARLGYRPWSPDAAAAAAAPEPHTQQAHTVQVQVKQQQQHELVDPSDVDKAQPAADDMQQEQLGHCLVKMAAVPDAAQGAESGSYESTNTGSQQAVHKPPVAVKCPTAAAPGHDAQQATGIQAGTSDYCEEDSALLTPSEKQTPELCKPEHYHVLQQQQQQQHPPMQQQQQCMLTDHTQADGQQAGAEEPDQPITHGQWPTGPTWGVADYEEEVRQLSEQLQELLVQNSSYKAQLQQRDAELKAQQELLDQQGYDLACCQDMLQELQDRLAASEAGAAASAAEHCDAQWARGQVQGLVELNQLLQDQLEAQAHQLNDQAEELSKVKAQLTRFCLQEESAEEPAAISVSCSESDSASADVAQDRSVPQDVSWVEASTQAVPQTAEDEASRAICNTLASCGVDVTTSSTTTTGCKRNAANNLSMPGGADASFSHLETLKNCSTPRAKPSPQQWVAPDSTQHVTAVCAHSSKRRRNNHQVIPGQPQSLGDGKVHLLSPFKQLRLQTQHLRVEPLDPKVATGQAALLYHQLEAVGLHIQRQQLEEQLGTIRVQLQQLRQQHPAAHQQALPQWDDDQEYYPNLDEQQQQEQPLPQPAGVRCGVHSDVCNSSTQPHGEHVQCLGQEMPPDAAQQSDVVAAGPRALHQVVTSPHTLGAQVSELSDDGAADSDTASSSSSTASTPRSSSHGSDVDTCEELLADLMADLHALATESHQASAFKAVSASTLSPLRQSMLQQQHLQSSAKGRTATPPGATSPTAGTTRSTKGPDSSSPKGSSSGRTAACKDCPHLSVGCDPTEDSLAALDTRAARKLQADLQVCSAYELAATRGLLHAGSVVQELKSALLATRTGFRSTLHACSQTGRAHQDLSTACTSRAAGSPDSGKLHPCLAGQPSPHVVRTLFSSTEDAMGSGVLPGDQQAAGVTPAAQGCREIIQQPHTPASKPLGCFSVLRQLQHQQQYIIQVLGSLSAARLPQAAFAANSPVSATTQLQKLADAQQQLQVLLHAASAAMQQAEDGRDPGFTARGTEQPPQQQVDTGADTGGKFRHHEDCWAGSAVLGLASGSDAGFSARCSKAEVQQLAAGSTDQQQQRDTSPDKVQRLQKCSPASAATALAAGDATQQRLGAGDSPGTDAAGQGLPRHHMAHQQRDQADVTCEVMQLRGQVIRLQLELQRMKKQQVHSAADSTPHAMQGLTAAQPHDPAATPSVHQRSQEVTSTPGGGAPGSHNSFGTPGQVLLLSGRNRELQAQCLQRDCQVRQLESEVQRLQLELGASKQQASAAASSGALTPRHTGGLMPRHGLTAAIGCGPSMLSPQRRATLSPGSAACTPRSSLNAGGAGQPSSTLSYLPVPRFACGLSGSSDEVLQAAKPEGQLSAAPNATGSEQDMQRPHATQGNVAMCSSLDDVGCTSSGSSRSRGPSNMAAGGKPPLQPAAMKWNLTGRHA